MFFYVLFFARFAIFVWLMKPKRVQRSFAFFYKEWKRTQRLFRSFLKNGKKNPKIVPFFYKERKRTQDCCILLKRTDDQPCLKFNTKSGEVMCTVRLWNNSWWVKYCNVTTSNSWSGKICSVLYFRLIMLLCSLLADKVT